MRLKTIISHLVTWQSKPVGAGVVRRHLPRMILTNHRQPLNAWLSSPEAWYQHLDLRYQLKTTNFTLATKIQQQKQNKMQAKYNQNCTDGNQVKTAKHKTMRKHWQKSIIKVDTFHKNLYWLVYTETKLINWNYLMHSVRWIECQQFVITREIDLSSVSNTLLAQQGDVRALHLLINKVIESHARISTDTRRLHRIWKNKIIARHRFDN